MRLVGIIFAGHGAAFLLAGGVLMGVGSSRNSGYTGEFPGPGFGESFGGICFLGAGAVATLVGVPLWIAGAQPRKTGVAAPLPSWAVPTVAAGPRSASLRWTF